MKIKSLIFAGAVALCAAPAAYSGVNAAAPASTGAVQAVDSVSVAVGTVLGDYIGETLSRMRSLGIAVDNDVFVRTMEAMLRGQSTAFSVAEANDWLDRYIAATRPDELPDSFTPESQQAFLDSVAAMPGAVAYPDGLVMIVELEGEGPMPVDSDSVRVLYTGRFADGTVFDSTSSPIILPVEGLAPGFAEGLKQMRPGGRYRIVMPHTLAYGPQGIPGAIPGNAALDFTVDLIEVNPAK